MKTIILSGSDDKYYPFLINLCKAIKKIKILNEIDFGIFDVGLKKIHKDELVKFTTKIIKPKWNCRIDFKAQEWKKLLVVRPFLKEYFPNYDLYIWIDADIVPLSRAFIDEIKAIKNKEIFICNENDDCYINNSRDTTYRNIFKNFYKINGWVHKNNLKYLGKNAANNLLGKPLFNAGFYALKNKSPIWQKWKKLYVGIISKSKDDYCLSMDQASLNLVLYNNLKKVQILNSKYNWLIKNALPNISKNNTLCKPSYPFENIEMLHFTCFNIKKTINLFSLKNQKFIKTSLNHLLIKK